MPSLLLHPPFPATTRPRLRPPTMASKSHPSPRASSPYEILGISSGATSQEIKAAYRRLARVLHPDVVATRARGTPSSPPADNVSDQFIRLHNAYSTLLDPVKRAESDRRILMSSSRRKRPLGTAVISGVSGYSGRNWETDQCW